MVGRTATAADEDALHRLDSAAWTPTAVFPSVLGQIAAGPFFSERCPPADHLVAVLDGEIVGYARLQPPSRLPENAHVLSINGFAVDPRARRRGVGAALLTAAERRARDVGAAKLSLRVLATNTAAIQLYERAGFVVEGRLLGEFRIDGVDVDDVVMARDLT